VKTQRTGVLRWKIRRPHRNDEAMPFHEWVWTGEPVKADSLGRLNGRMWRAQWADVRCLYTDCPAQALIRIADLVDTLPKPQVRSRVTQPVPPAPSGPPSPTPLHPAGPLNQPSPAQPEMLTAGAGDSNDGTETNPGQLLTTGSDQD
jgi:hypothetical protein